MKKSWKTRPLGYESLERREMLSAAAHLGPVAALVPSYVAAPDKLVFNTQPSGTVAGVNISPAVQVLVEDADGDVLAGNTSSVTLAIANNPAHGSLGGTATVAAVNGIATFGNLSVNTAGVGYTLKATDGALSSATSISFNVVPATASKLVFATQPSGAVVGANISPAVQVWVEDANGNVLTGNTSSVTLALANNPAQAALGGTLTVAAVNGVATFSNLSINTAGGGYTLKAADGSLAATSASFNVVPATASKLVFTTQPSGAVAGANISPAVQVSVEDANGHVLTGNTSSVSLALANNPANAALGGTLTVAAVNGVATFSNLAVNMASGGYTLKAADGGLVATSSSFNVVPATASKLVFTTQPSGTVVAANISPAVQVSVEDANGNVLAGNASSVTLALANNPANAALGGTLTVAAVNGVATFSNLAINTAGGGYTLKAADGSLVAISTSFNVVPATASKLAFATQPSNTGVGSNIAPAMRVLVEDANGNVLAGNTSSVTLAIANNPASGKLGGTLTVAAVNGVATFSNVSINTTGTGYTLWAADGGLVVTSASFNIVPANVIPAPANKLVFTTQPSNAAPGASISPAVQVLVEDANGHVVVGNTSNVTLALASNPANGTLGGTLTVAAVNGVATFSNLSINKAGTGYTLQATDGTLNGATSGSFNIVTSTASTQAVATQPSSNGSLGALSAAGAGLVPASPVGGLAAPSVNDVALLGLMDESGWGDQNTLSI